MIFVDTNVFMYAVGRPHPHRAPSRTFFEDAVANGVPLFTSAEVLQELVHAYMPVRRIATLDAALELAVRSTVEIWNLEQADVRLARQLLDQFPELGARDLCHLATCRRRNVSRIKTYDRGLGVIAERHL